MLIDNNSAAETANKAKVNEYVKIALDFSNPEIIIDLHEYNNERPSKYDSFWKIATQFLKEKAVDAIIAIDEYRYNLIIHLTTAISINDFLHQIEYKCLFEILISNAQ